MNNEWTHYEWLWTDYYQTEEHQHEVMMWVQCLKYCEWEWTIFYRLYHTIEFEVNILFKKILTE